MSFHETTMGADEFILRGTRVVLPDGLRPAGVHVRDSRIHAIHSPETTPSAIRIEEASNAVVMPGVVDTHVHINQPGRTAWEGFETATRAAVAGGITTLIEMPLNSIPATTTVEAFHEKVREAEGTCVVDTGFWGGVVPGNAGELQGLYEAGVFGFKCFLIDSGVPEFRAVTERDLREALPVLAKLGAVLLAHSELPGPIEKARAGVAGRGLSPTQHSTWLTTRPREAEHEAIGLLIRLCREFRVRTHIVHLASADALPILRAAREEGLPLTVETCPHYLTFATEQIPDGATEYKCAPPLREAENRERLWAGLADGTMDLIASDHSPSPPELKRRDGNFLLAWGGIASLQISLAAAWTEASRRGHSIEQLARWMCRGPARLAGLAGRKGSLEPGYDADIVVWEPEAEFVVEPDTLHHRHKLTPYAGRRLRGVVAATYLRGEKVFDRRSGLAGARGKILRRGPL